MINALRKVVILYLKWLKTDEIKKYKHNVSMTLRNTFAKMLEWWYVIKNDYNTGNATHFLAKSMKN